MPLCIDGALLLHDFGIHCESYLHLPVRAHHASSFIVTANRTLTCNAECCSSFRIHSDLPGDCSKTTRRTAFGDEEENKESVQESDLRENDDTHGKHKHKKTKDEPSDEVNDEKQTGGDKEKTEETEETEKGTDQKQTDGDNHEQESAEKTGVGDVNINIGKNKPMIPMMPPPPPPPPAPPPPPPGPSTSDVLISSQMSKIGDDLAGLETKIKDVSKMPANAIPSSVPLDVVPVGLMPGNGGAGGPNVVLAVPRGQARTEIELTAPKEEKPPEGENEQLKKVQEELTKKIQALGSRLQMLEKQPQVVKLGDLSKQVEELQQRLNADAFSAPGGANMAQMEGLVERMANLQEQMVPLGVTKPAMMPFLTAAMLPSPSNEQSRNLFL